MKTINLTALAVAIFLFTAAAQAATIDMVTVGNPGNAPDTRYDATGFGSVGYVYQIGKYEVTAGQYTEFLNAVAKQADPNGLYNPAMGDTSEGFRGANIQRTGSAGNFSYTVAPDWANRPVNYVSFWDAARLSNWLHNGQPIGAQGPGTTEDGAYVNVGNQTTFARQPNAKFFIPTEDEWYKAAYHDKTANQSASYFDYPTGTNALSGRDTTESTDPGNNANYYDNGYLIGSSYYRTIAGEFELSDSPYGTFDQGGNIWEWDEMAMTGSTRGLRGGSFHLYSSYLQASSRDGGSTPTYEDYYIGFRVASSTVPEPSTPLLGVLASTGVLIWRKRHANRRQL